MEKSKLGRKRTKRKTKGNGCLRESMSGFSTPVRSGNVSVLEDSLCEESPPFSLLCSQAAIPEKEVYWDYDTPQIRKYRSRMGLGLGSEDDDSPAPSFSLEKVSTPKLRLNCESRTSIISQLECVNSKAITDMLAFNNRNKHRKKLNPEGTSTSTSSVSPEPAAGQAANPEPVLDSEDGFGDDDDSLLLRCTQEVEEEMNSRARTESKENLKQDGDLGFESDDSLELIMSQMDETEFISEKPLKVGSPRKESELKRPLESWNNNGSQSPTLARSIKRFKSSDDGIPRKPIPLRRIQSSPVIPDNSGSAALRCSQAEIERKKLEARRRRELSQLKR